MHDSFFLSGGCKAGAQCRFKHPSLNTSAQSLSSLQVLPLFVIINLCSALMVPQDASAPCVYHSQGYCAKGQFCTFSHAGPAGGSADQTWQPISDSSSWGSSILDSKSAETAPPALAPPVTSVFHAFRAGAGIDAVAKSPSLSARPFDPSCAPHASHASRDFGAVGSSSAGALFPSQPATYHSLLPPPIDTATNHWSSLSAPSSAARTSLLFTQHTNDVFGETAWMDSFQWKAPSDSFGSDLTFVLGEPTHRQPSSSSDSLFLKSSSAWPSITSSPKAASRAAHAASDSSDARLTATSVDCTDEDFAALSIEPQTLCEEYFLTGHCADPNCADYHGDLCRACGRWEMTRGLDDSGVQEHEARCLSRLLLMTRVEQSRYETCGICLEAPAEKGSQFGLLESCAHVFCLECIRSWRANGGVGAGLDKDIIRACPVCRINSYLIIPSRFVPTSDSDKCHLLECYKAHLKTIHCRHFNMGKGHCPFGNSCFYKHEYPDGKPALLGPRLVYDSSGASEVVRMPTLADFIVAAKPRKSKKK